jgi:hypothetical protein
MLTAVSARAKSVTRFISYASVHSAAWREFKVGNKRNWGPPDLRVLVRTVGRLAMQENQEPRDVAVETVRSAAWQLLEKIRTTSDQSAERQLARRAFQLAQFAGSAEKLS